MALYLNGKQLLNSLVIDGDISSNPEITELCCLNCVGRDMEQIPYMSSLPTYNDYADYLSYNTSTRKFEALQDFTAVMTGWVYQYQAPGRTYSFGCIYKNSAIWASYNTTTLRSGDTAGRTIIVDVKANDLIYPYTPNGDGYPEQHLKIYKLQPAVEITPEIAAFVDEGANT